MFITLQDKFQFKIVRFLRIVLRRANEWTTIWNELVSLLTSVSRSAWQEILLKTCQTHNRDITNIFSQLQIKDPCFVTVDLWTKRLGSK